MRTLQWFRVLMVTTLLASAAVHSATPAGPPAAQSIIDALSRANAAVVGVEVKAAEGAKSIQTLGAQRSGSGVVIGQDGLILTIGYLMLEAQEIRIVTQDNKVYPARPVAYDLATGFGLVQSLLPLRGVQPVELGSHREVEPGEPLLTATGAQADDDADVAMTQLVSKRPFSGYWEYHIETALFTSPPIGNHSGAPLFNQKGELLGIGSLFVMDALGDSRRLPGNMFVPVDLLKPILAELRQTGSTKLSHRPWLGLTSTEQGGRVQVVRVSQESPAQDAGLKTGDVVLAVDGTKVSTLETFYKKVWDRPDPNGEVELTVLQGADIRTVKIKAVDRMNTMLKPAGI
ncbi:S1C family serine protease [Variovorax sp. VNK109]|uniref:S1C family serine protease n=1 Tax=Variovorax sp. VNK109 TaxID=3400919 RepID=UPI003C0A2337